MKGSNSPILSLENNMNFAFVVAFDFLAFGRVESTEAHGLHHFHLKLFILLDSVDR